MKREFEIEDKKVMIERIKWKEKSAIIDMLLHNEALEKLLGSTLDESEDESNDKTLFVDKVIEFIEENASTVEEFITKYTDLDAEKLGDFDVYQVVLLLKQIIEYNGIKLDKIKDFFMNTFKLKNQITQTTQNFIHKLPQVD